MWVIIYYIFSYLVFFYTILGMGLLLYLCIQSIRAQKRLEINLPDDDTIRYALENSPITPSVSIIAPAFNEEETIRDNIKSLMKLHYPDFNIIIVNDGSTDKTMDILIDEFSLVEVPFNNSQRVPSKPIKRVFRSSDEKYSQIVVVDKEPGGRKADATNAGLNVCESRYFISTDVDCIIEPMALYRMMWLVVNSHRRMIGVGATMLMNNGCTVEEGVVTKARVPNNPLPWFQQMEYMRSFLIGKMGWSATNTLSNISGGFGLFDTEIAIRSGGYYPLSMAEDVDMLLRMITYMKNTGQDYALGQIPQVCCWTQGPFTPVSMYRQRVRWARGLCEIISNHRKLFFNPHYGLMGSFTLPYILMFEFMAPIIEISGFIFMIWLICIGGVNWQAAMMIFAMIFIFSISLSFVVLIYDLYTKSVKWNNRFVSYLKLALAGILEPIIYHPFLTFFSIVGYIKTLRNRTAVWTKIKRKSMSRKEDSEEETEEEGKEEGTVNGEVKI